MNPELRGQLLSGRYAIADRWDENPPVTTSALGRAWLQHNFLLLLKVLPAILPCEFNYLLHP
ncbi:MAG: hypothetical protein JST84_04615 [Acidobacteria bacterium]|nr:hypothetical protein [Acidobacteriota bacterium]